MTPIPTHWQRNLSLFLTGQFCSGITSMTVQYAIIWYLTKQTGSATILSMATLLGMLPMVLLSPFIGPLVDRFNKKALLIIPDLIAAVFAVLLFISGTFFHQLPIWLIFAALLVRSVAQTFQMPTIQSILPIMVPDNQLTRANGQLGMVQSANMIISPALGAFLFAVLPLPWLILLDVLGAVIGVALLMVVHIPVTTHAVEQVHVLSDTKLGLQQLIQNRGLWAITIIGALFTLLFMPAVSLYPLMTMSYFHGTVSQAGLIEMVYAGGMLTGGALISFFGKWSDRIKLVLLAYAVIGITIGASGLLPGNQIGFYWFVALNVLAGIATPFFNTLLMAMIQQSYPPQQLGRIMGIINALLSLTGPVGLIFAGPLADVIGVEKLFIIAGVGTLLCGLITYLLPQARQYDQHLQQHPTQSVK